MKSQVNFIYDFEDDSVDELKHWLFLENVKLTQQKQQLESEIEDLNRQKAEFESEKMRGRREIELKEKKLSRIFCSDSLSSANHWMKRAVSFCKKTQPIK